MSTASLFDVGRLSPPFGSTPGGSGGGVGMGTFWDILELSPPFTFTAGGDKVVVDTPPTPVPHRDKDGYVAIKSILEGLREFDEVRLGPPFNRSDFTSQQNAVASIQPLETDTQQDGSPNREFRLCRYVLTFAIRADRDDEYAYLDVLDRLDAVIRNAMIGPVRGKYGEFCLSAESRLGKTRIDARGWPVILASTVGTFGYSTSFTQGYDTSEVRT